MGSTLLLACLLLSQVRTMVCPACRSIGAAGLMAVAGGAAAAEHTLTAQYKETESCHSSSDRDTILAANAMYHSNHLDQGARHSGVVLLLQTMQCCV
jgi:hypothetical protein